jgi:hypothetical protein
MSFDRPVRTATSAIGNSSSSAEPESSPAATAAVVVIFEHQKLGALHVNPSTQSLDAKTKVSNADSLIAKNQRSSGVGGCRQRCGSVHGVVGQSRQLIGEDGRHSPGQSDAEPEQPAAAAQFHHSDRRCAGLTEPVGRSRSRQEHQPVD